MLRLWLKNLRFLPTPAIRCWRNLKAREAVHTGMGCLRKRLRHSSIRCIPEILCLEVLRRQALVMEMHRHLPMEVHLHLIMENLHLLRLLEYRLPHTEHPLRRLPMEQLRREQVLLRRAVFRQAGIRISLSRMIWDWAAMAKAMRILPRTVRVVSVRAFLIRLLRCKAVMEIPM